METRACVCCGQAKPISGVWYLMADDSGAFMCGTCFSEGEDRPIAPARA